MCQGDIIIFDKGYYSYKNYAKGILEYKIVPFIFPKEKFNPQKLETKLNYPLEIFSPKTNTRKEMLKFKALNKALFEKLSNWKKYKPIRGKIEDFFKLCKEGLSMKKIHRYTKESVFKHTILNVFLAGLITALGYNSKRTYNGFPNTKNSRALNFLFPHSKNILKIPYSLIQTYIK